MLWTRMLAYITGTVDQELLLRNEYPFDVKTEKGQHPTALAQDGKALNLCR